MCKIASVPKVTDKNRDDVWLFMMTLGDLMSSHNKDGLGYAAFNKNGDLFGERWLVNKTAFTDMSQVKNLTADKMNKVYNFFGDKVLRDEAQAIILHTRMATCEYGLRNVHPFINDIDNPKTAIIHNGMIGNDSALTKKYSTCDSEVIVHLYEDMKVSSKFENIKDVMTGLFGWFTVLALSKDDDGQMVMDAFTDSPRLASYYIPELETRVYSTQAGDIAKAAKMLGMTCKDLFTMSPYTAHRISVLTGEVLDKQRVKEPDYYNFLQDHIYIEEGNYDEEQFVNTYFRR